MSAPLPETKICSGCGLMLPLLDFDRCKKGLPERRAKCRECRLEVGKKFRDTKRRREAGRLFSEVHRKFVHGEDEGAILFVNAMITRFGGLDAFVRLVRDWMVDARTPASFRCKLALTLIHLIESLALRIEQREQAAAREASERLGAMPGEVLSEELEASALRLLRGRGWTVTRA